MTTDHRHWCVINSCDRGRSSATTYAYDNADRLTSVTAPATRTVAYGYDAAGRRTSLTYPGTNHQATCDYTIQVELASVAAWSVGATTYTYDDAGRLTGITMPNGTSSTHQQDMTDLEDIEYVVNAVGNRTQMTDSAGTTTWSYDALDRLTGVTYPNGDTADYGYDAVGNRTSHTVNGATTANTFDAANRMTASGSDAYTYDANGNQSGKTVGGVTTTYSYDALDRLTDISGPTTASYTYNGDGLRVAKTVGGNTTRFTWDVLGLPQVIADGNEYVWGHGLISQVTGSGTATYAHADGLGSIRLLTDQMGAVVGTQQYDAFGAARGQTGTQLPFSYTGEQVDAESGLVYLRARYMDPSSGRFVTRDPRLGTLSEPVTQHANGYARNNPLNWIDPTGEFGLPAILAIPVVAAVAPAAVTAVVVTAAVVTTAVVDYEVSEYIQQATAGGGEEYEEHDDQPKRERVRDSRQRGQGSDRAFDEAARGLGQGQKRRLHDEITGEGLSLEEMIKRRNDLFPKNPHPTRGNRFMSLIDHGPEYAPSIPPVYLCR